MTKSQAPDNPVTDIGFSKLAEPVPWRGERRAFIFLAFDGSRLAPT
jgi:hypothetical protein